MAARKKEKKTEPEVSKPTIETIRQKCSDAMCLLDDAISEADENGLQIFVTDDDRSVYSFDPVRLEHVRRNAEFTWDKESGTVVISLPMRI